MADKLTPLMEPARGKGAIFPMLRNLEEAETFGNDTDFSTCIKMLQARHRKKGMVLVVSDFLYPKGFESGLRLLQGLKHDVYCLQIHDENDLSCNIKGDVELECVETQERQRVTITPREAKKFIEVLEEWNANLKQECRKRGLGYLSTTNIDKFEEIITGIIRKGGLAG